MGSICIVRKPPHAKTFGVEIECYPIHTEPVSSIWYQRRIGFFENDSDGSLNALGREFISQPLPYNMLRQQIKKLYKKLDGWRVDYRCGLHIHVSRQYWNPKREEKFSRFLRAMMSDQINTLFGRNSSYADRFADRSEKYRAVNVCHDHTYEFRLWAAGDIYWTLEALRRTKLIVEYRGEWSYDNILELFTKPTDDKPINIDLSPVQQAPVPAVPAVRRVRRV